MKPARIPHTLTAPEHWSSMPWGEYYRESLEREEPAEHDVLLARIARGEGLILLPASFSAIQRQGVVFCPLQDASQQLPLRLGMVTLPANERVRERVTAVVEKSLP